ncbi:hypothetical protein GQ457_06G006140 [Hibiscus cannabinus]
MYLSRSVSFFPITFRLGSLIDLVFGSIALRKPSKFLIKCFRYVTLLARGVLQILNVSGCFVFINLKKENVQ